MLKLSDVFDNKNETLESVVLLPPFNGTGRWTTGKIVTLPDGLTWSDFESVEIYGGWSSYTTGQSSETSVVSKEQIRVAPTSWFGRVHVDGSNYGAFVARSSTTGEVTHAGNGGISSVKGFFKKYGTSNKCAIVPVN